MHRFGVFAVLLLLSTGTIDAGQADAEAIKIGVLKTSGSGPVYLAQERGYFAAEGPASDIVFFEAGIAIPAAVVSGEKARAAGLKAWKDIAGRTFSIGAVGTLPHYSLVLIAREIRRRISRRSGWFSWARSPTAFRRS